VGKVSIIVALPLLNQTAAAGKSKWEDEIGSEGFTSSEALICDNKKALYYYKASITNKQIKTDK